MSGILHKFNIVKDKFLAASWINNECSDQEKDNFCEEYLNIFANEIFHISSMKEFSYFEMEKNCHFIFQNPHQDHWEP